MLGAHAATFLRRLGPWLSEAFGILTYHRVAPDVGSDPGLLNVTPGRFREQLTGLLQLGYQPWPLRELLERRLAGRALPQRAFAVVFDDGYEDVYLRAWPVLRRWQIPATIFLATAYLDANGPLPFAPWVLDCPDPGRCLTTAQCLELQAEGFIELGCHTHTHGDFRGRPHDFAEDLAQSLEVLATRFGVRSPLFSFPYGFADEKLVPIVIEAGLPCGLTTVAELVSADTDTFLCGRFGATQLDTPHTLAAKLDGWYSFCRSVWRKRPWAITTSAAAHSPRRAHRQTVRCGRTEAYRAADE